MASGASQACTLPDFLRDPSRSRDSFRRDLTTYFVFVLLGTQHIRDIATMRYMNLLLTLTLTYADNVALPAFARRGCSNRSASPARRAHSSKPAAAALPLWTHAGTNTRTGRGTDRRLRTPYRFIDPAALTVRAVPINLIRIAAGARQLERLGAYTVRWVAREPSG